jgi:2'-5' RNA ligase
VRLFVALQIPTAVRESFAALLSQLRSVSAEARDQSARWVRPENLHVTLKFIGEAAPEKLSDIRNTLTAVRSSAPVSISFHGLGFFPNEKHPRVFWAGMDASPNLPTLAADLEQSLEPLGFPREQRPFTPHLTLARFEPSRLHEKLRAFIQENTSRNFGSQVTSEFHLIESKLKSSGAEYTTLQTFRFAAAEA